MRSVGDLGKEAKVFSWVLYRMVFVGRIVYIFYGLFRFVKVSFREFLVCFLWIKYIMEVR